MGKFRRGPIILKVAVPSPLRHLLDYLPPANVDLIAIKEGVRVMVPLGTKKVIGVILKVTDSSTLDGAKLKLAEAILDQEPILSNKIIELINWTSSYYHHPIGEVINHVLPKLLRDKKRKKKLELLNEAPVKQNKINKNTIELNQEQQDAINAINQGIDKFIVSLLDGVTGSGKTEVYLRVIAEIIALGKQALVLIPEINLTPQTLARFSERFAVPLAVFHSRLTLKERLISWQMARLGIAPIIIGTRSAIFTPLKNPGIIIVDEEHDLSFKQQSGLRYSARDLAVVRGKLENIPVVLGSATPSIESIYNARRKRYQLLKLPERAGKAIHPSFHLIDMRSQKLKHGIAEGLLLKIKGHLNNHGQVLVFLNRRGYAPVLICHSCGWVAGCKSCDAKMVYHQKHNHLRCHHCGIVNQVPAKCPACGGEKLFKLGAGTERVEVALQEIFPDAKIVRIDRDTTRHKNSLEEILDNIQQDRYQILIGTQMLAKGHHFPKVTMVAVLNVDQSLFSSDFRSSEHLAQLVIQVAGRAGRVEHPGEVYLQTYNPHHPLLLNLINGGYHGFVDNCFSERHSAGLPPYSYLSLLQAESKVQDKVTEFLTEVRSKLDSMAKGFRLEVFGPIPSIMERKAGYFRMQLLLQGKNRDDLRKALDLLLEIVASMRIPAGLRWFLDVDPLEMGG